MHRVMLAWIVAGMASGAFGADWKGWIADQKCVMSGKFLGENHKKCVSSGQSVVFVNESDHKIYDVDSQEKARGHVGKKVSISGTVRGDTIVLDSIADAG